MSEDKEEIKIVDPKNIAEAERAMNSAIFFIDALMFGIIDSDGCIDKNRCIHLIGHAKNTYNLLPMYHRLEKLEYPEDAG